MKVGHRFALGCTCADRYEAFCPLPDANIVKSFNPSVIREGIEYLREMGKGGIDRAGLEQIGTPLQVMPACDLAT